MKGLRGLLLAAGLALPLGAALAQSDTQPKPPAADAKPAATETKPAATDTKPAPSTPDSKAPPTSTPPTPAPAPTTPSTKAPPPATTPDAKPSPEVKPSPDAKPAPATPAPEAKPAPDTKSTPAPAPDAKPTAPGAGPHDTEIEPNGSPGIPENAQTESVTVPARPIVTIAGRSSYDDAFKSIKASLETVKKAMDKAGLKPAGHPVTIFSEPDDKGFKYKAAIPIAAKPDGKPDLGADITIDASPAGKAIKFQHRGAYEDIDSTYDVITAYLDAKGLQVDNPYIEEYLTDLTTPDDPNLQVDIYVFVKP